MGAKRIPLQGMGEGVSTLDPRTNPGVLCATVSFNFSSGPQDALVGTFLCFIFPTAF